MAGVGGGGSVSEGGEKVKSRGCAGRTPRRRRRLPWPTPLCRSPAPLQAADYRTNVVGKGACDADVKRFCATVAPGKGRMHKCLRDHMHELRYGAAGGHWGRLGWWGACWPQEGAAGPCWACWAPSAGRPTHLAPVASPSPTPCSARCLATELRLMQLQAADVRLRPQLVAACSEELAVFCKGVAPGRWARPQPLAPQAAGCRWCADGMHGAASQPPGRCPLVSRPLPLCPQARHASTSAWLRAWASPALGEMPWQGRVLLHGEGWAASSRPALRLAACPAAAPQPLTTCCNRRLPAARSAARSCLSASPPCSETIGSTMGLEPRARPTWGSESRLACGGLPSAARGGTSRLLLLTRTPCAPAHLPTWPRRYCAQEQAQGHGQVLTCLVRRYKQLQGGCQDEMSRGVRLALWGFRLGQPLTQVCDSDVQVRGGGAV